MINIKELKAGHAYLEDGQLYVCIKNELNKQARAAGKYGVKRKDLRSGAISETTYNSTAKVEPIRIEKRTMQYSYNDQNGSLVFMDNETYETIEIPEERLTWELNFLVEGNEVEVTKFEEEILGVALPVNVAFKIIETEAAVKGDTATSATKNAVIETGFQIQVPLFISEGEVVLVDTETGKYKGRA